MSGKVSLIIAIVGVVKVGKSHLAMLGLSGTGEDTIMIDATPGGHAKLAAMNVYGDMFEEKYFHVEEDAEEIKRVIEEHPEVETVCIDESKNMRDAFAKPVLKVVNEERAAENKKPVKTIFPITRWADVYKDIDDMFREYEGVHNFIVTGGLKEKRVYDSESKMNVPTGKKEPEGLRTLSTLADVGLIVSTNEKDGVRKRLVSVKVNRLLDYASDKWIGEVKNIGELIEEVCNRSKFEKSMFLV